MTNKSLEDLIASRNKYKIREIAAKTPEMPNEFDREKNNYSWLAKEVMIVINKNDMDELMKMGYIITKEESTVYGKYLRISW